MKRILFLVISLLILSCEEERKNFVLEGNIKGLKKGTVYLQRKLDSSIVSIDSVAIKGDSNFTMSTELAEPEVLYLRLNKNDDDDGLIRFFADQGTTVINTTLDQFILDAKIEGSVQQQKLEEYQMMISKFNDRNLDLIKQSFDNNSQSDSISTFDLSREFQNLTKRKYLYTINFAFNNKDSEVSPYLAVAEIPDATTKYLDTIYNALTKEIKISKYGKELESIIANRSKQ